MSLSSTGTEDIPHSSTELGSDNQMKMDNVCHMEVDEETALWKSDYNGKTYYFCAPACKHLFDQDPDMWAN